MRRLGLLLAVAALGLSACGGKPEDDVTSTVTSFRDATAARDYAKICKDILSPALVSRLDDLGLPCETALAKYLSGTRKPKIEVRRVTIKGKTAKAFVRAEAEGQPPANDVLGLVKVGDGWRIATLGAGTAAAAPGGGSGTSTVPPGD